MKLEHRTSKLLLIAAFTAACVAIFAWLFVKAGGSIPGGGKTKAQALVPTAFQLVPNADVRRAGVKVGRVRDIQSRGDLGLVSFEVDKDQGPLYRNATVRIRTKTLVGENYLDIDPGDRKTGELPQDGTLPVTQAGEAVQLDQILSGLDERTRASVQRNLSTIGGGLGDRGPELNRLFGSLPNTFDRVTEIDEILKNQRPQLARTIEQTGQLMQAFANRTADVRRLAIQAEATARAAAERDQQIGAALNALPDALRQVKATSTHLGEVAGRNTSVVADLRVAAQALPAVTARLERSSAAGRQVVSILPGLSKQADPMLAKLTAFGPEAKRIVPPLDSFLREANPFLRYVKPYSRELGTVFANLGSAAGTKDAVGYVGRIMLMVSPYTVTGLPKGVQGAVDALTTVGGLFPLLKVDFNGYPAPGTRGNPTPLQGDPPKVDQDPSALGVASR
ncbi:MlaD family protein [Patulibacter brassicae]|uniref:MlaD family protein n=1 Tax=Patulibacter brassicae TaxID=1705717 RepID=A0ABU4VHT3_9ACTN|nr:MlaD family protein [Patulibacter brassicae]MDX8150709.1 MlaD family protein [Patulibacter brassicae]